jgi:hypothetical protein
LIVSVRDADGKSFSTVAAGIVIADASVNLNSQATASLYSDNEFVSDNAIVDTAQLRDY